MSTFVRRVAVTAAVLMGAALVPSQAQAQNVLDTQADSSIVLMGREGLTLKQFRIGSLAQGANAEFALTMPAGKSGVVIAVCDQDCSDIDLKVSGGKGDIGSDYETDDTPVVAIENFTGRMTVRVEMASCSIAPCGYRLMLFVK